MSEPNADLEKQLDALLGQRGSNHSCVSLILFFSFDLVGSTEFKEHQKEDWLNVWTLFYGACLGVARTEISESVEVWKYIGDEVLLRLEVADPSELNSLCGKIFDSMREILDAVRNELDIPKQPILDSLAVKATAWISLVHGEFKPVPVTVEDTTIVVQDTRIKVPPEQVLDFIGPNIDIGFRIAKYTFKWNLAISVNLGYLVIKCRDYSASIRMVDMQKLKGVMGGAYYPILWFRRTWGTSVAQDFDYDDQYKEELALKALTSVEDAMLLQRTLDAFKGKVKDFSHFYEMNYLKTILRPQQLGDASWTMPKNPNGNDCKE